VVVDPGVGVTKRLDEVLAEHRVNPVAVLLTHGHLDHTFSVTPVCSARSIPAYLHPGDDEMLADPTRGLSTDLTQLFGGRFEWVEPDDVRELADGATLTIAGLEITVDHAPGHTRGSVLFRLPGAADVPPVCLSGDVLFAGSIGRTDGLPNTDPQALMDSIATLLDTLPDETRVLPGHGPATTLGRERASNPFLQALAS
jgi:glyoxylase-like metal-dependent hydrolase (beta-lactamase superfamily II)